VAIGRWPFCNGPPEYERHHQLPHVDNQYLPREARERSGHGFRRHNRRARACILAQLYAGKTPDSLSPVGVAVPFQADGSIYYGKGYTPLPQMLPGSIQMRAWEAAGGTTYEAARDSGYKTGFSNVIRAILGSEGIPQGTVPADLVGMQGFSLTIILEPASVALFLAGLAWFVSCRAKGRWRWGSQDVRNGNGIEPTFDATGGTSQPRSVGSRLRP
jgi:hypothetical protein